MLYDLWNNTDNSIFQLLENLYKLTINDGSRG